MVGTSKFTVQSIWSPNESLKNKKRTLSPSIVRDMKGKRSRHSSGSGNNDNGHLLKYYGTRQERKKNEEMQLSFCAKFKSASRSTSTSPQILGNCGLGSESCKEEKYRLVASLDFAEDARKLLEAPLATSNNHPVSLDPQLEERVYNPTADLAQIWGYQRGKTKHEKKRKERTKSRSRERGICKSPLHPRTEPHSEDQTNMSPLLCSGSSQVLSQITACQPKMSSNIQRSLLSNDLNESEQDSSTGTTQEAKGENYKK